MRYLVIIVVGLHCFAGLQGQSPRANFSMNGCLLMDEEESVMETEIVGNPECVCGVDDTGWRLRTGDQLRLNDGMQTIFSGDFALSFFYSPRSDQNQVVMLYGDSCSSNQSLTVLYEADLHRLEVIIRSDEVFFVREFLPLSREQCWHHVVVTRTDNDYFFYLDGGLVNSVFGLSLPFAQSDSMVIGGVICESYGMMDGVIDELRLYNEGLQALQAQALYVRTDYLELDQAVTQVNQPFQVNILNSCATSYSWSPTVGVSDPSIANPVIQSPVDREFVVEMFQDGCSALDTFNLLVVDSSAFECSALQLPTAFTPNGDGLNEDFGILNPFLVQELETFRIFDRWGGLIFETQSLFERWDASTQGVLVNPGVFHYEVLYTCSGEKFRKVGAVKVIR